MNENSESVRHEQLLRCIPDIFKARSLLYVGGHFHFGRDLQMVRYFNCTVDVVEAWPGNVEDLKKSKKVGIVYPSDIMDFLSPMSYDVTMFWHGPEHLTKEQVPVLINKLANFTSHYIVLATPNGVYRQGPEYGNPYEVHKSHWTPAEFTALGLKADAIGKPNQQQGNIIAWKKFNGF